MEKIQVGDEVILKDPKCCKVFHSKGDRALVIRCIGPEYYLKFKEGVRHQRCCGDCISLASQNMMNPEGIRKGTFVFCEGEVYRVKKFITAASDKLLLEDNEGYTRYADLEELQNIQKGFGLFHSGQEVIVSPPEGYAEDFLNTTKQKFVRGTIAFIPDDAETYTIQYYRDGLSSTIRINRSWLIPIIFSRRFYVGDFVEFNEKPRKTGEIVQLFDTTAMIRPTHTDIVERYQLCNLKKTNRKFSVGDVVLDRVTGKIDVILKVEDEAYQGPLPYHCHGGWKADAHLCEIKEYALLLKKSQDTILTVSVETKECSGPKTITYPCIRQKNGHLFFFKDEACEINPCIGNTDGSPIEYKLYTSGHAEDYEPWNGVITIEQ